ncbi:hypothetical protein D9758_002988 [Tetrapyrgos nigripes]|uniref:Uncharacterized protein n=1 Tax=Tetrapyrgos nigripes TaxID=182062 RepID=A0A8H5GPP1_9AGAR|nr:hypothetical protein D9758_002988 [Tetrapyrgos nigripes]
MPSLNLAKLISEPFGPYPEEKILQIEFARKRETRGVLREVWMDMGKKVTGLDHTEFVTASPSPLPPIRFFGILDLENLDWLSDQGKDWLQKDLRERDEIENGVRRSGLTLERLYGSRPGEGSAISVYVMCVKTRPAACFSADRDPTSLIFYSEPHYPGQETAIYREYLIKSLDVETYTLSQQYFTRSRLLAFLVSLKNAPSYPEPPGRTIDWLVEKMRAHHKDLTRHRRFMFDAENDSDVDEEGRTTRPRHLWHVSRAHVKDILAKHADWLLAQMISTNRRDHHFLNLPNLYEFCCSVNGKPNLAQYGPGGDWEKTLQRLCINPRPTTSRPTAAISSRTPSPEPRHAPRTGREYESDISEESSAAEEDSDTEPEGDSQIALGKLVPVYCIKGECQQMNSFKWYCPDRKCDWTFDLTKPPPPPDPNTEPISIIDSAFPNTIPVEDYTFLMKKTWRLDDKKVQEIAANVMKNHLRVHMRRNGVDIKPRQSTKMPFMFIPWPEEYPMEGIEKMHHHDRIVKEEMEY